MIKIINIDLPFEKILAQRIGSDTPNIGIVAIIKYHHRYLLVKNAKYPSKNWLFLTGKVEKDENDAHALSREIKEETNLDILNFKKVAIIKPKNIDNAELIIFQCEVDGDLIVSDELTEVKLFTDIPDTIHPICKLIIKSI